LVLAAAVAVLEVMVEMEELLTIQPEEEEEL
jgi:hypothetical protein